MKTTKGSDLMGESPNAPFRLPSRGRKRLRFPTGAEAFSITAALMLLLSWFPCHHCSETRRFQPYVASITALSLLRAKYYCGPYGRGCIRFRLFSLTRCQSTGWLFVWVHLLSASELTAQVLHYLKFPLFILLPKIQVFIYLFEQKKKKSSSGRVTSYCVIAPAGFLNNTTAEVWQFN